MTDASPPGKSGSDSTPKLDRSVLLAVVDGDVDLLRGISKLFLDSYPVLLSAIREAIAKNDRAELGRAAHTFQGSAGYFLTNAARHTLIDLERIAREGEIEQANKLFAQLELEMERLKPEVLMLANESQQAAED